ncbi:hypothetical protein [Pararhizobium sp. DWP3-4]|uniref:hypothetical protein n=1 Tax=Pararhizobium sp. DWP3-4 TaxID=2804565 RepID=UPI003CF78023
MEQAVVLLHLQEEWTRPDLEHLLLPIFAKRHEHRRTVLRLIDELLTQPTKSQGPPPPFPREDDTPGPREPIRRVSTFTLYRLWLAEKFNRLLSTNWLPTAVWVLAAILFLSAFAVLLPGLFRLLIDRTALIVSAVGGALTDPLGSDLLTSGDDWEGLQIAVLVRHATVSALVATGVVVALLGFRLKRDIIRISDEKNKTDTKYPEIGDGSVFRTGSLGGRPRPFLDQALASEIIELITYRPTADFRSDLDLWATVDRRVRGDMDSLVFERRKELPTIVILVDVMASGRHWNTLASEFQTALEKRGLLVEAFPYSGGFTQQTWSPQSPGETIERAVDSVAERNGWMLTTLFGDLKRISERDLSMLAALREQGPVLGFDYVDPRLWDNRHFRFESLGMGPHPATGHALRQALAVAFAPDRGAIRAVTSSQRFEAVFHHLTEPHAQWASACATIEPMSFALAERLRNAHPALVEPTEALAYSLLTGLPESWMGKEGLQFSPNMRRQLLSRSAKIPREQQDAFLEILDDAFGQEPAAFTAGELWRFARAQAELFSPRQDRAMQDLADIKKSGIIHSSVFDDFINRLRLPGDNLEQGTIQLPQPSRNVKRLSLSRDIGQKLSAADPVFAVWSLGLSEVRVRIGSGADPLAGFFREGRHFFVVDESAPEVFSKIDAVRGTREAIEQNSPIPSGSFSKFYPFLNRNGGVLTSQTGELYALLDRQNGETGPHRLTLSRIDVDADLGAHPLVAISPASDLIACAKLRSNEVTIVSGSAGMRPERKTIPGNISAIAFSQAETLLCGDDFGNVFELPVTEEAVAKSSTRQREGMQPITRCDAEITALTDFMSENAGSRIVVATLANGVAILADEQNRQKSFVAPAWRAKQLTIFPDRRAALMENRPTGVSMALIGESGEFDILGLSDGQASELDFGGAAILDRSIDPNRDGLAVLAISPERRRVIVRSGFYLEVRPLTYDLPEPGEIASDHTPSTLQPFDERPATVSA